MKTLALLLLSSGALAAGGPAPKNPLFAPLPAGAKLTLPVRPGTGAQMIVAPPAKLIEQPVNLRFGVDRDGYPWLGDHGKTLLNVLKRQLVKVDQEYTDVAFFDNGAILLCTKKSLGFLEDAPDQVKKGNKYLMRFHPVAPLPYKNMRLFAGDQNAIYLVGRNPKDGKDELFALAPDASGKKAFVKLAAVKEGIAAVAGDGRTTYFASGRLIAKLAPGRPKAERVLLHPSSAVTQLAYAAKSGLFYATDKAVGYVGKKPFEFLKARRLALRLRNDALFVLFVNEQHVLCISGASGFSKLGAKL